MVPVYVDTLFSETIIWQKKNDSVPLLVWVRICREEDYRKKSFECQNRLQVRNYYKTQRNVILPLPHTPKYLKRKVIYLFLVNLFTIPLSLLLHKCLSLKVPCSPTSPRASHSSKTLSIHMSNNFPNNLLTHTTFEFSETPPSLERKKEKHTEHPNQRPLHLFSLSSN